MNLVLEINNLSSCNFDEKKLKLTIEKTIAKTDASFFLKKNVLISVVFISESEIKKINKKYRNKNSSTDILSFGNYNSREEMLADRNKYIFLGELLICWDDIVKYCQKENILFEKEFFKVTSHGVLHLLGFDHSEEMFKIQKVVAGEMIK